MAENEKRLARRVAEGDCKAFEEFIDRYGDRVHRLVRRYVANAADAEDVTQEIFIDLYRSLGGFRGQSSLATFVYRVAVNHCFTHQGRRAPATESLDAADEPSDQGADPARHAARRELATTVQGAVDDLSRVQRDVVILHELHGLTYQECATVLNVPVGTVKSRLSNGLRALRQSLGNYVLGDAAPVASGVMGETS